MMITRMEVVEEARTWIDTPFRDQGYTKGIGVDCLGLIKGLARDLNLCKKDIANMSDFTLPYGKMPNRSVIIPALKRHLVLISRDELDIADIILYLGRHEPQHLAIKTDTGIIHSYQPYGAVKEHSMTLEWANPSRMLGIYRFPIFVE